MVSDIKGAGSSSTPAIATNVRKAGSQAGAAAGGKGAVEQVSVTDLAARLQRLTDSVKDLPVVDQARVAELRDQLANGDYAPDDTQIADKLASFEAMLGSMERG